MQHNSLPESQPKVSVLMITYNHERFIEQAVRSVMMQVTDFDYELVIGEDCSTDRTRDIVNRLREEFSDSIRLILHPKNVGMIPNFISVYECCRGEYVALLEGDDYWSSPSKLQKQVELMYANPRLSLSFHSASVVSMHDPSFSRLMQPAITKPIYTLADLISLGNFIPTASAVFVNGLIQRLPAWISSLALADYPLFILLAEKGDIGYLAEPMSVYRRHAGGVWSANRDFAHLQDRHLAALEAVNQHLGYRFAKEFELTDKYRELAMYCMEHGDAASTRRYFGKMLKSMKHDRHVYIWRVAKLALGLAFPRVYAHARKAKAAIGGNHS